MIRAPSCSADTVISFTDTSRACSVSPSLMIRSASRLPASMILSRSSSRAAARRNSPGNSARSSSRMATISPRSNMKFVRDIGTERAPSTKAMISSMRSSGSTGASLLSSRAHPAWCDHVTAVTDDEAPKATPTVWPECSVLSHPGHQSLADEIGDVGGDVPAPLGDLFDEAGGQERVQRIGRHEQRLDPGQAVVHLRHLQLVVEIAHRAQPFDHDRGLLRPAEVDQQAAEGLDPDIAVRLRHLAENLDALLDGEQARLVLVDQDPDDHLVEEPRGPADDVEVPVGDRVERAGTDRASHDRRPYQRVVSP